MNGCGQIMMNLEHCEAGNLCDVCQGKLVKRLEEAEEIIVTLAHVACREDVNDCIGKAKDYLK